MGRSSVTPLPNLVVAGFRLGLVLTASLVLAACPYLLSNAFLTGEEAAELPDVPLEPSPPPDPDWLVWVANRTDGTVSVIEDPFDRVANVITVGPDLQAMEVSPDGTRVLVASPSGGRIYVLDAVDRVVSDEIVFAGRPFDMAYSPDGSRLYVAVGSALGAGSPGSVVVFDAATFAQEGSPIAVGNEPLSLTFAGQFHHEPLLYTANTGSNDVSIIDPATAGEIGRIAPPAGAVTSVQGACCRSGGTYFGDVVLVAKNPAQRYLDVISVETNAFEETVSTAPTSTYAMVYSPVRQRVYGVGRDDVVSVRIESMNVFPGFPVSGESHGAAISPDDTVLYVTDAPASVVYRAVVDDTVTGAGGVRSIAVGGEPWGVALTPYWP